MRNKATKKNMDLDLRRYGNKLYSKAEESGGSGSGGSDGGGSADINTILDNISIKDDLLTKLRAIDYTNQGEDGVLTDLTFDDVFNDYNDFIKSYLYREQPPLIGMIGFFQYNQIIRLGKGNANTAGFEISDGDYISYVVYVDEVNNGIEVYVIKNDRSPI